MTVPMSSPCNLVYIPSGDNRSKGEKTYYQRQAKEPGTYELNEEQLDKLCYPGKQELEFVNSTSGLTEKNYFSFLEKRKQNIVHRLIEKLYK